MKEYLLNNYLIKHFKKLESTNLTALEFLTPITDNTVIITDEQTKGRGKGHNIWHSLKGNLFLSIIKKYDHGQTKEQICFVTAVALRITIESISKNISENLIIENKWPNDIYLNKKKLAGILIENNQKFGVNHFIIGVGVNIKEKPSNTEFTSTSLSEHLGNVDINFILEKFLENFDIYYDLWKKYGFLHIKNIWLEKAYKINEEILINNSNLIINKSISEENQSQDSIDNNIRGIFRGITDEGYLKVEIKGKNFYVKTADLI